MGFVANFFQSVGAMDGNQWGFVIGTNVITGGVTYYATRKAYEVDDEENKKPAKKKAKKAKRTVKEEPEVEVVAEPKAEVKEEPKAKEKQKAKQEPKLELTQLMAKISAEEMLQKIPKKGWKSEDYVKATELITQQLLVGLEHDKEALKEAKDKIEQALKANPDMPVNKALRVGIREELKASKIPLEEPLIAFLKENGLPFKDTAKRA